jgi:hypothetical protein
MTSPPGRPATLHHRLGKAGSGTPRRRGGLPRGPRHGADRDPERGSVTAYTLVLTLAVLGFAGLVLDAGLAVATKVQAISTAQSAARAGARDLDLTTLRTTGAILIDPTSATATARDWLARAGVTGTVAATPQTVTVTVRTSRRTQLLRLVGVTALPVSGTATATAVQT